MTKRNIEKEISYDYYRDMEDGNDTETICYPSLICILTELIDRIEELEQRLDKNDKWKKGLAKVAKEVSCNVQENVSNVQESANSIREINSHL